MDYTVDLLISRPSQQHPQQICKVKQEAQLSQRGRAMLRIIEYFARSFKVIENGIIWKLGYGFLFAFYSNYGRIFAVSTQYTNVTDSHQRSQSPSHRTTA